LIIFYSLNKRILKITVGGSYLQKKLSGAGYFNAEKGKAGFEAE
jgi:hypothetical protein